MSLGILGQCGKVNLGQKVKGKLYLVGEHDAHQIHFWGHELSRNMGLRNVGEFF